MKLNYKRTILVGFAFFLISAFWQAYDNTIPLILTNKFGMSQTWSGLIMTLDNILALFMLPLFGSLSDKCSKNKMGKRKPFILVGTICAAIAIVGLSFVDNMQLRKIDAVSVVDDPAALTIIYDSQADQTLQDPDGKEFVLQDLFTEEEFTAIRSTDEVKTNADGVKEKMNEYTRYVVPARKAYAAEVTAASPNALVWFIVILLITLVSMATFRSPAVALMPDVTLKPLRSKGNAIINLMGAAGGIIILLLGKVLATGSAKNAMMSYTGFFGIVAGVMIVALAIFMWKVDEKNWAAEMQRDSLTYGIEEKEETAEHKRKLSSGEMRSLILVLLSVALWYFGYNAVTSKYSVYASTVLQKDHNTTLILAQAAAILSYIPVGMVASKIGRRKTILAGVVMLTTAFAIAAFMRMDSPLWLMNAMFILAGIAWATINVNSFPMVVEMCSGGDVGKYTGYYYTASMAAQSLTPTLSGNLMDRFGMTVLFPYAAVFVALAFVTMLMVRHGDGKVEARKGLEAFDTDD